LRRLSLDIELRADTGLYVDKTGKGLLYREVGIYSELKVNKGLRV
jgi:hypothetical protein